MLSLSIAFGTLFPQTKTPIPTNSDSSCGDGSNPTFNLFFLHERFLLGNASFNIRTVQDDLTRTQPDMQVEAGSTFYVQVTNYLIEDREIMKQYPVPLLPNNEYDMQNIPGQDEDGFQTVNIHLHGARVIPHVFFPLGTSKTDADWIDIPPLHSYCYRFELTKEHPSGTFIVHPHYHGNVMLQMFTGAFALLTVGSKVPTSILCDNVDVRRLILWTINYDDITGRVAQFNQPIKKSFLSMVNNVEQPLIVEHSDAPLVIEMIGALSIASKIVYILNAMNERVTFHVVELDAEVYGLEVAPVHSVIINSGTRLKIFLSNWTRGNYSIMSQTISFGVNLTQSTSTISTLVFDSNANASTCLGVAPHTPNPQFENYVHENDIVFDRKFNNSLQPFPQFVVNDRLFDVNRIDFKTSSAPSQSNVYWNFSVKSDIHVYHQHVCPAYVTVNAYDATAALKVFENQDAFLQDYISSFSQFPIRDTFFTIPTLNTTLFQNFSCCAEVDCTGKSLIHCHILNHEDQGMISTLLIE